MGWSISHHWTQVGQGEINSIHHMMKHSKDSEKQRFQVRIWFKKRWQYQFICLVSKLIWIAQYSFILIRNNHVCKWINLSEIVFWSDLDILPIPNHFPSRFSSNAVTGFQGCEHGQPEHCLPDNSQPHLCYGREHLSAEIIKKKIIM